MDPQLRKTIASRGGKAAHATGHAHEFSADEARAAGWKGGMVVSGDRAYMAELGRRGGYARARNRRARAEAKQDRAADGPQPDLEVEREPSSDP